MIAITREEHKQLLELIPQASIRSTKHRAYLIASGEAIAALSRIRGENVPTRRRPLFSYTTAEYRKRQQNAK